MASSPSSPLMMLIFLSGIMAASSFIAGLLPLSFKLSPRQLRIITTLGSGLLIGTALVVIIPEGVETIYSAQYAHGHGAAESAAEEEAARSAGHAAIGMALVLGFAAVYLVDVIPDLFSSSSSSSSARARSLSHLENGHHIPLSSLAASSSSSSDPSAPLPSPATLNALKAHHAAAPRGSAHTHSQTTTLGLLVHSLADGIALGAASTASSASESSSSGSSAGVSSTGLLVFAAILVHKAPAAFGLTATLLRQGIGKRTARAHLLLFSLAAPLGALLTYAAVRMMAEGPGSGKRGGEDNGLWWTGVVMVGSGGSFL
jgi:zinc transporter 9